MARKFFYVCAGMLMLALAYHFGASSVSAQVEPTIVGAFADNCNGMIVVTANGNVFVRPNQVCANTFNGAPVFAGNFWAGSPTPSARESWGQLKSRYAPKGGSTSQPGTTDR